MGGTGNHADGVTVWRRFGERLRADIAARAKAIFNQHRLTHLLGEFLAYSARDNIERTARRGERNDAN